METKQAQKQEAAVQEESKEIEQSDLIGNWNGHIVTDNKRIPIELVFQEDGDIHVNMPIQFESMQLNKWFFTNGHLKGWYAGNIPGEHLLRCPQTTLLNLEYRNGKLIGTAAALASNSSRMHYALSYYLELEKKDNK